MKLIKGLLSVLVTIGALNWGLVGTSRVDLVARLFGRNSPTARVVYSLVGLAGLYQIVKARREAAA